LLLKNFDSTSRRIYLEAISGVKKRSVPRLVFYVANPEAHWQRADNYPGLFRARLDAVM